MNDSEKHELEKLLSDNYADGYHRYITVFNYVMKIQGFSMIQDNQVRIEFDLWKNCSLCFRIMLYIN